ncbi:hypothetical protein FRC11_000982, partial [Ceratobasidium sp. 423]
TKVPPAADVLMMGKWVRQCTKKQEFIVQAAEMKSTNKMKKIKEEQVEKAKARMGGNMSTWMLYSRTY